MRKIKFEDFQKELISSMKSFQSEFENNEIFWWANSGTLLGAVRDSKLIDWDDDIDMSMFNRDFYENKDKIIEIANKLNFELIDPSKQFGLDVARMFSNEYLLVKYEGKEYMTKIYIDIMLAIPSKRSSKFKSWRWEVLNKFSSIYGGFYNILPKRVWIKGEIVKNGWLTNFLVFLSKMIIWPFTFWVPLLQNRRLKKYKKNNIKYQLFYCYNNKGITFERDKKNFTKIRFEDFEINAPKNYEDELIVWFGNSWKELPSKEKRIPHNLLLTPYTGKEKYKIVPFLIK